MEDLSALFEPTVPPMGEVSLGDVRNVRSAPMASDGSITGINKTA
jgi:hypothetical protein